MPRVLAIGNCGFDESTLRSWLLKHFAAELTAANDLADAITCLERESFDLVLVNRVLDCDGSSGLDIVRALKSDASFMVPLMLVSNYPEAHVDAIAAGAEPGFGKNDLYETTALDRVAKFLTAETT